MVQVGTDRFIEDNYCMPTTIEIEGNHENWMLDLPEELQEYTNVITSMSDGYTMKIEITIAENIQAGAIVGTCIQGWKTSGICV